MRRTVWVWAFLLACVPAVAQGPSWWAKLFGPPSDYHVYLKDAGGLVEDSVVQWRGVDVGRGTRVKMEDGRVRVDMALDAAHRRKLHDGIKAWPSPGFPGREPNLRLIDTGKGEGNPIRPGSELPEAKLYEAVTKVQLGVSAGVVLFVVLIVLVLKGIKKLVFVVFVVAIGVCAYLLLTRAASRDVADRTGEMQREAGSVLEELAAEADARAVAEDVRRLVEDALSRAREEGPEAVARIRRELRESLGRIIGTLRDEGKRKAAEGVERLRNLLDQLLAELEKSGDPAQP